MPKTKTNVFRNDFFDMESQTFEYSYDKQGNLTADYNKGITSITYNHLNLPEHIVINNEMSGNNGEIYYTYDATGRKLAKKSIGNSGSGSTLNELRNYIAGFEYTAGSTTPETYQTEEGRIIFENDGTVGGIKLTHEYHLKDHLGNTRLSFTVEGKHITSTTTTDYYPFGAVIQKPNATPLNPAENHYLYNHKELQQDFGLQWYDYGFRFYDAILGRFYTQDRFAEKYVNMSGYQYAANNPMNFIDVNGDSLKVSGAEEDILKFQEMINNGLNGFYTAKNTDGNISLEKTDKDISTMNEQQKNFYGALQSVIGDDNLV